MSLLRAHRDAGNFLGGISASFNAMALNPAQDYAAVRGSALDSLHKNSAGGGPMKRQPTNQICSCCLIEWTTWAHGCHDSTFSAKRIVSNPPT